MASAFRRDENATERLLGAIRGSCFMDLTIGIIMVCCLEWGGIDDFPCAPHKYAKIISRGEWVRYLSYIVYGVVGLAAIHLRNTSAETSSSVGRSWAACMFVYLFIINLYIMFWSVTVMGFGFTLVHRREACAQEFNIIFASSFSIFTFLLGGLHGTMCGALSLRVFRCAGCVSVKEEEEEGEERVEDGVEEARQLRYGSMEVK